MGDSPAGPGVDGSVSVVPLSLAPAKFAGSAVVTNGAFELCLPANRYTLLGRAADGRGGAVDVDLTKETETFIFLDEQRLSDEQLMGCLTRAELVQADANACALQGQAPVGCGVRGAVHGGNGERKAYTRLTVITDRGACYRPGSDALGEVANVVTRPNGEYELTGLPCGATVSLIAWTPSSCAATIVFLRGPSGLTEASITLE